MTVYGLNAGNIDEMAESLSRALAITLYRQFSPMIGAWYSDASVTSVTISAANFYPFCL